MEKRKALIVTNIALAVAGTSLAGLTGYMAHREGEAREGRVAQLVQRFHGCPERFSASQECFSEQQRSQIFQAAERAEAERRWEDAATDYARLIRSPGDEMETKAREMAGNCGEDARRAVGESIRVRLEAVARVSQEPPPVRSAPAVSAPAPAVDAGVQDAPPAPTQDAGEQDAQPVDPAPPQERTVTITFRADPSGVDVRLGDESRCTASPECSTSFPVGSYGLDFTFSKAGYRSRTQTIVPDQDRTVDVRLEQERHRGRGAPPRGTSTPRQDPLPVRPQPTGNPGVISSPD